MPRIRTIKPEFWTDEKIIELSLPARLLFIGLWNFCDDRGVIEASPRSLKAKILPADDFTVGDVEGLVRELLTLRLITAFEAKGREWWYVTHWHHQVINRPSPSRYPEPPRATDTPLPSAGALEEGKAPRGPSRSTAGAPARMSPSRSTAAGDDDCQGVDLPCTEDDSLSTHGALTEDSSPERKGEERKGEDESVSEREDRVERDGVQGESSRPPPKATSSRLQAHGTAARGARLSTLGLACLPENWKAFCRAERPDLDPERIWARFTDHWNAQPGQRGVKLDWLATWRNWVRNERRENGHGGSESTLERRAAINAEWRRIGQHAFDEVVSGHA